MVLMSGIIENTTGVILAGGENTRMPELKAFIKVNGKPVIERNLGLYLQIFDNTFVVTNEPEKYSHLRTPMLGDIYDIRGPMTGILTSLINSPTKWIFVSACDMPFINKGLIRYMAGKRDGFKAVAPRIKGKAEPLFAFYSKELIASMEKALLDSRRGLRDFLKSKKVKYINFSEIKKVDPGARSFINLNTPDDLRLYLQHRIY
jgi:molybdopterin-guanine dinucleotide biosynthesis protein A